VLLLLLAWGSAAPASAESGTITTARTGPINVFGGETLTIADGGSVTSTGFDWAVSVQHGGTLNIEQGGSLSSEETTVVVFSGMLNMHGGSVSGPNNASMQINPGCTATISGGSVSGLVLASGATTISGTASVSGTVQVQSSTTTISGGSVTNATISDNGTLSISSGSLTGGVQIRQASGTLSISGGSVTGGLQNDFGGTATVSGCSLAVANGQLTGILQDGTPINTPVSGPITLAGPTPAITLAGANPLAVECHTSFTDPGATASDACGSIAVSASGSVDPNTPGSYTITYHATDGTNPTTQTRTVNVVDTIPPVITLIGSSPLTVDSGSSFTDPGATANDACAGSVVVTPSGIVDVTKPGSYTLTYNATDGTNAATPVIRTVTVVPVADVSITQMAGPNPVPTGSTLTYAIVVSNAGPQAAQGVALTDTLPAGTSFVSAARSSNAGTLTTPRGNSSTVSWSVGTLGSGQSVTLTLVVKVGARAGATITNTASVSSSSLLDPNAANNSASVSTSVGPRH